jgi:CBS domain-containing protein
MAVGCAQPRNIEAAVRDLMAARDEGLRDAHLFTFQTLRRWHELEQGIAARIEELEQQLDSEGELASEVALARAEELRRAVHDLLQRNAEPLARCIMTADVATCRAEDTLERAAQIMWERDCGAVPVLAAGGALVGMITDRDVCMAAYTQGAPLRAANVGGAMSRRLVSCHPDDPLARVAEIMSAAQVRRLLVTDRDGQLLGVVSLGDLARYVAALPDGHPSRGLLVPLLASISEPRDATAEPRSAAAE